MNETYDVSAFRAVFERSFTWISGFLRNVRRFGEKTAVIDPASGRTWTYAALNQDANRLANALLAAGVGPGDEVLEAPGVDGLPGKLEAVARRHADHDSRPGPASTGRLEGPAQPGDVHLQGGEGLGRGLAVPQVLDQPVGRHHPAGVDQQVGQQGPLGLGRQPRVGQGLAQPHLADQQPGELLEVGLDLVDGPLAAPGGLVEQPLGVLGQRLVNLGRHRRPDRPGGYRFAP